MKELKQRRTQHRIGAKIHRVQALVDWSQAGQHHHSIFHLGGSLTSCRTQRYIIIYIPWGGIRILLYHCTIVWLPFLCSCIPLFYLLIYLFILFIYIWLRWVFVAACGLSLVAASGGYSSLWWQASHCSGFSCCGAWTLGTQASVVVARGLSSCGSRALERRLNSRAHGFSCSVAWGIFPDQGSNPCPLHWQVDS